ncbi:MAG: hypothetical protein HC836_16645 [Richelia sp. RM2_1_2]|nr:hypothetical protein [Richelia sp. RM2_1_2]
MKIYELYSHLFAQSKKDGKSYVKKNINVLRFLKERGISQRIWEDFDDQMLDNVIKTFNNTGIIQNRLPNIGEWVVTIAVQASIKETTIILHKALVKSKNYHTILPKDAFNYRNVCVVYFTDEECADDFMVFIKISFSNQYKIVLQK